MSGRPSAHAIPCPWPGPKPYGGGDTHVFFAREQTTQSLQDEVRIPRITVLTGDTGCGKTSLLDAGLLPALRIERALGSDTPLCLLLRD